MTTKELTLEQLIARRRPQVEEPLLPETIRWLASLPNDVRPRQLPIEFARLCNGIARHWDSPRDCLGYLEDLLIDRRGGRSGFSFNVALEIAGLKDHYETVIHPTQQTAWDLIMVHHY